MTVSKKEKKRLEQEAEKLAKKDEDEVKAVGLEPGGRVEEKVVEPFDADGMKESKMNKTNIFYMSQHIARLHIIPHTLLNDLKHMRLLFL